MQRTEMDFIKYLIVHFDVAKLIETSVIDNTPWLEQRIGIVQCENYATTRPKC